MSLPFIGIALLEAVLRLANVGEDLTLVKPAGAGAPAGFFRLNPNIDRVYYGPADLFGPEDRPYRLPRPGNTYRIVVIGASTVAGFPYSQELSFPRFLEIALNRQGLDRTIEVLNAGIVAINTFGESDMVEQALACSPDLIVVYTGQNEFVGPGGVGSTFGGAPARWTPALFALRRTRLHQCAMRMLLPKNVETQQLLSKLLGDLSIRFEGRKFRQAEQEFRVNLERMAGVTSEAGVPLLLTSPITNLRSFGPIESLHEVELTERKRARWQDAFDRGERALDAGDFQVALGSFDEAQSIDDGHAMLAFRRGRALEGLERLEEARTSYQAACDLDACRFRAPGSFGRIAREVAASVRSGSVSFCDTAAEFARGTPHGIPGAESLLEHVHFTYEGNWRLAMVLAERITRDFLKEPWREDRVPSEAERDSACGILTQDHLSIESLILMMYDKFPMMNSPEAPQQVESIRVRLREYYERLPPREQELFGNVSTEDLQFDLIGKLATEYAANGLDDEAGDLLRKGVLRRPWDESIPLRLAEWDIRHGNFEEARRVLDDALKWRAESGRAAQLRAELPRVKSE